MPLDPEIERPVVRHDTSELLKELLSAPPTDFGESYDYISPGKSDFRSTLASNLPELDIVKSESDAEFSDVSD
jgi:hypothetical protein